MTGRRLTGPSLLVASALVLSGCGFSPLYSTSGFEQLAGVQVQEGTPFDLDIAGGANAASLPRFNYLLQNAVRDFAGPGQSPYTIIISGLQLNFPVGVSPTGLATRVSAIGVANWNLRGPDFSVAGSTNATLSYDQSSDVYSVVVARSTTEELLARQLAEQIVQDVALELRRHQNERGQ